MPLTNLFPQTYTDVTVKLQTRVPSPKPQGVGLTFPHQNVWGAVHGSHKWTAWMCHGTGQRGRGVTDTAHRHLGENGRREQPGVQAAVLGLSHPPPGEVAHIQYSGHPWGRSQTCRAGNSQRPMRLTSEGLRSTFLHLLSGGKTSFPWSTQCPLCHFLLRFLFFNCGKIHMT